MRTFLAVMIVAAVAALAGAVVVSVRQEQCVSAVLRAHSEHLSTWEAVELCQRRAVR
jgi:hypothetical protein